MSDQSLALGHVVKSFNEIHKIFIIGNLAIDNCPVIYANDKFNELLEKKRGEIIGKSIANCELWLAYEKIVDQSDKWNQLKKHIKEKKEYQFQAFIRKSSGKHINCRLLMTPIKNTELIVVIFEIKEDQDKKRRKSRISVLGSKLAQDQTSSNKQQKNISILKKSCSTFYSSKDAKSDKKLSIISQLFLLKHKAKDGACINRSKSLENTTGMLTGNNKQVLIKDQNSCGNLDRLNNLPIDKSENDIKRKDQSGQRYQLKFKLDNKTGNNLADSGKLLNIKKQRKLKNLIKNKAIMSTSKSMTNDLRSLHLHVIENELKNKLKTNQLNNIRFIEQEGKIHDYIIQDRRRKSTGEMLKHQPDLTNNNNELTVFNRNDFARKFNENLLKSNKPGNDYLAGFHTSSHSIQLQTPTSNTSIDLTADMNEDQSIKSKLSRSSSAKSISSSKNSVSKSSYSKASSSSSSISPFRLPFGLFTNKTVEEKRGSFSSMDSAKGILKGVQNKLTTNLSNKVAQKSTTENIVKSSFYSKADLNRISFN